MTYRGIIFDIDGTAVPYGVITASDRLRQVIHGAQANLRLAAATGRSYGYAQPIFTSLGITSPSIIMGGSAIIDPITHEVVWSKSIGKVQSDLVLQLLTQYKAEVWVSTNPIQKSQKLTARVTDEEIYTIWASEMEPRAALRLMEEVAIIPKVTSNGTPSWVEGLIDVHITHVAATKQHAVQVLLKKLNLQPAEVVGVGDSDIDIPTFLAVGHKVAMANATPGLMALADEIAPSLSEDGLATIIEKYARV